MIKSDAFVFIHIGRSESNIFNTDALMHACLMLSNACCFFLIHVHDLSLFVKFVSGVIFLKKILMNFLL